MREVQAMKFENRDTEMFMELVRDIVAARYTYLLPVNEYYKINPGKTLLGYYDKEYIYLIPSVITGMCEDHLTQIGMGHLNIQLVLNTLFRANLIKVNWVMRKDLRYRPEKRIGNTRRRYITFIRNELKERRGSIDT
jgi:hypothetical protein